jgi:hypothetical protein
MSFTYPAQGTTANTRELLTKVWTGESFMPTPVDRCFYDSGMAGVKRVPVIQGTQRQFQMIAEGSAPVEQDAGDDIDGQIAGRSEGVISRQEKWLQSTHKITYNDLLLVPSAIAKLESYTRIRNEQIWGRMDLWLGQLCVLQARATTGLTSQGQFIHAGGTRQTRSGGGSTNAKTAVETQYTRNSAGGTKAYDDLAALADSLDKKNISRAIGARPIVVHTQFYNALLEFNDARLFSKDYIDVAVGGDVQRRQVTTVLGFTIVGQPQQFAGLNGAGNSILGGRLPGQDYTTTGIVNARGTFQPVNGNTAVGAPVVVGAADVGGDVGVVEFWEDQGLTNYVEDDEKKKQMIFHTYMLPQMGAGNPAGAYCIEVTF